MDSTRLANVIFNRGQKITQTRYQSICESIDTDMFTLDEYVLDYKKKEQFMGKIAYRLDDGSSVLISEKMIEQIRSINMDKTVLESYMKSDYTSFKSLLSLVAGNP
jgi:hypothetical protein